MELVRQKAATESACSSIPVGRARIHRKKLQKLLCSEGYRTEILTPQIVTDKREDWVNKRVKNGLQVLITNPRCVETGLDLNAFTTIIFYSMGYNLFTLRQASRRSADQSDRPQSGGIYALLRRYHAGKGHEADGPKLAVAGIIEGTFSEEGLAAMSDVKDLTSQMAKELALGIRDNVEDIAAAFQKMAVMNPERKKNITAAQPKETAAEEQKAPAAKGFFGVRTAQAQVHQALYEGLLARLRKNRRNGSRRRQRWMKTSCRSSALLRKGEDYLNVTINRAEMLSAIKRASAIAPADSPLDVLRGVFAGGGCRRRKAHRHLDYLEAALEEKLPCAVQENGALVFGAKMLAEMLSRLPQDTVQLCRTENQGRMTPQKRRCLL